VSREEFDAAVRRLREDIPRLTDNQIAVGSMRLFCRIGDGHTGIRGAFLAPEVRNRAPVKFYLFREGLFITDAHPRHADLAGAQVLRIGGHAVEEVLNSLKEVVLHDNDMGPPWLGPEFLRSLPVLNGLGIIPDDKSLPLTVRDAKGKERNVALPGDSGEPEGSWVSARKGAGAPEPLYLKKRQVGYWFEYLPEKKLVYFQYNQVQDGGEETIEKFCGRLFRFIDDNEVRALVIDLRWNGGGNNFLNRPLVHGLIRCDKVNQPGKLFVVVGRNTFSAAMCAAADLERHTKAVFVGEPTGSSPNFVGESAVIVHLPYSKLRASISDLYWQNSVAMDYRTWIAPQIYTPPTFAAYRANRDPALEAILADLGVAEKEVPQEDAYTISTVAGNGEPGFSGDGGPAREARLNRPCAVAVDREGSLYIADYMNHRVRKVGRDGTIATLAGTGEPGFGGDGGPAAKARLQGPYGVSVDRHGNVYVADQRNNRVRKITAEGLISTVAGNGKRRFEGDGGPATAAALAGPDATVSDEEGNLYIADSGNHRVRKVSPDGTITTVAGTEQGFAGDRGPAVRARLNLPAALALDPKGNLYVGDFHNHVVRKVSPDGVIQTVAGTGERGFNGDGLPATRAELNEPGGVGVAPDGSLLIADGVNFRVRRVGPDGIMRTIAGTGREGYAGDGGPATQASLSVLDILAVDGRGNVYIADHGNDRVRRLTPTASAKPGEKR
jgi:sugar lactone lactonase YvrE